MSSAQNTSRLQGRHQKRTACNGCGDQGRYDIQEFFWHEKGCLRWYRRYLCRVCLWNLRDLTGPGEPIGAELDADIDGSAGDLVVIEPGELAADQLGLE